jgi:hypothetical protein
MGALPCLHRLRSATVSGCPRVTTVRPGSLPHRARIGHGQTCRLQVGGQSQDGSMRAARGG